MVNAPERVGSRTIDNIALAYFADLKGMHDAVRDLCSAGFPADHINVSTVSAQDVLRYSVQDNVPLPNAVGAHSFRWLWNRIRLHDRHRRGADQLRGLNPTPPEGLSPTCSTLDLSLVLTALAVPHEVIWLLQQDSRKRGAFLLVDAPDRVPEASAILSENAGYMRTEYLARL